MSLFNQLGALLSGGDGADNGLLQAAQTLFDNNGGLPGLVEKFQSGGLGEVVSSWVSSGGNLPISAEQIQSVLGNEQIAGLASQLGIDSGGMAQQLAERLPGLIDQLTPNGELPQGDMLAQGASLLGNLFGNRG